MTRESRFWDRIASKYAAKPVPDAGLYEKKLAATRALLTPDARVLEFGCGTGSTAIKLAPHARSILATDFSERMIEIARDKAVAEGLENVRFEQVSIEGLQADDCGFDMVLGHSILHLVDDPSAVLAKVHRILKPKGCFVSSTACLADGLRIFKWIGPPLAALGAIPKLQVFSRLDLLAMFDRAGFDVETEWQPGARKGIFLVARKRL
ncbi:MAG: class I SAM-dependent methyltransferase [Magnetovibrionaceae bacterium]